MVPSIHRLQRVRSPKRCEESLTGRRGDFRRAAWLYFFASGIPGRRSKPSASAFGTELEYPPQVAAILKDEAVKYGLALDFHPPGAGGRPAPSSGQGEPRRSRGSRRRRAATSRSLPDRLFPRTTLAPFRPRSWRPAAWRGSKGKRLDLGPVNAGTHYLAETVLQHLGWHAGADYQELNHSYRNCSISRPDEFPDAVFCAVKLLWPQGQELVKKYDLRLVEVPLGEVLTIRNHAIEDVCIPAYTYGVEPGVPKRRSIPWRPTAWRWSNARTPKAAIVRWLTVLYESDYSRRVGKGPTDPAALEARAEYPLHPGAVEYLHRNDPWLNRQLLDQLGSFRSFLVSAASAMILIWTWYRRRCVERFDQYLRTVSAWEIEAWKTCRQGNLHEAQRQNC